MYNDLGISKDVEILINKCEEEVKEQFKKIDEQCEKIV